jgi:hypothetical protein
MLPYGSLSGGVVRIQIERDEEEEKKRDRELS